MITLVCATGCPSQPDIIYWRADAVEGDPPLTDTEIANDPDEPVVCQPCFEYILNGDLPRP